MLGQRMWRLILAAWPDRISNRAWKYQWRRGQLLWPFWDLTSTLLCLHLCTADVSWTSRGNVSSWSNDLGLKLTALPSQVRIKTNQFHSVATFSSLLSRLWPERVGSERCTKQWCNQFFLRLRDEASESRWLSLLITRKRDHFRSTC